MKTKNDPVAALDEYVSRNETLGVDEEMAKDSVEQDYKALNLVPDIDRAP